MFVTTGKITAAVVGIAMMASALPAQGQGLKALAGRWELQRDSTARDSSVAAPVAARGARGSRAWAARGVVAGRGGAGAGGAQLAQRAQILNVTVRGDTIISTDTTTTAAQTVVVRIDTFVVNGVERPHESSPALAALGQRAGAGAGAGAGRLAGVARAATQPVMGIRRVEKALSGVGFIANDSASRVLPNRTVEVKSQQAWTLSADGKTLTIDTTLMGANTAIPTKRIFQLRSNAGR